MTKCTWCADRLRAGLKPACATHCPTGALDYAEVAPAARVLAIEGLPQTRLGPSLHVVPLAPGRRAAGDDGGRGRRPDCRAAAGAAVGGHLARDRVAARGVHARRGRASSAPPPARPRAGSRSTGARSPRRRRWPWRSRARTSGAARARGARCSTCGRSWLSREIAALSAFFGLATLWLALAPGSRALGWGVAAVGFAGLFAADQLYGVLPGGAGWRHSAGVTWIGLLLAALLARVAWLRPCRSCCCRAASTPPEARQAARLDQRRPCRRRPRGAARAARPGAAPLARDRRAGRRRRDRRPVRGLYGARARVAAATDGPRAARNDHGKQTGWPRSMTWAAVAQVEGP